MLPRRGADRQGLPALTSDSRRDPGRPRHQPRAERLARSPKTAERKQHWFLCRRPEIGLFPKARYQQDPNCHCEPGPSEQLSVVARRVAHFLWSSFLASPSGWHPNDGKNRRGSCHSKVKRAFIYFSCRRVSMDQENEPAAQSARRWQSSAARFTKRDRVKFRVNVPAFTRAPTSRLSR